MACCACSMVAGDTLTDSASFDGFSVISVAAPLGAEVLSVFVKVFGL